MADKPTNPNPDENAPPLPDSDAPAAKPSGPETAAQVDADEAARENLLSGGTATAPPDAATPSAPPPASPPIEGTAAEETAAADAVPEPSESAVSAPNIAQQTAPDEEAAKDITRPTAAEKTSAGCLVSLVSLALVAALLIALTTAI